MEIEPSTPVVELDSAGSDGSPELETELETSETVEQTVEELEDYELDDDLKLKVPKSAIEKLKSYGLRQSDYTQKTQALADERRQVQEQAKLSELREQVRSQNWKEAAQLQANQERLAQLQSIPRDQMMQLIQSNPQAAQQIQLELNALQAHSGQLLNSIQTRQQQLEQRNAMANQEAINRGNQELSREIKGWGPELKGKLYEYSQSLGLSTDALGVALMQPAFIKLLHKSYLADQQASRQQPAKPVTRVDGGGVVKKALSDVTDPAEWARRRREWKSKNR